MPTGRNVHVIEANGNSPAKAHAHMQRKLRLAAEIERRAHAEVDRLSALAYQQGWTLSELADVLDLELTTLYGRRRRGFKRLAPGRPRRSSLNQIAPRVDPKDDPETAAPGQWADGD